MRVRVCVRVRECVFVFARACATLEHLSSEFMVLVALAGETMQALKQQIRSEIAAEEAARAEAEQKDARFKEVWGACIQSWA